MDQGQPQLSIVYSASAAREMNHVWDWNVERYESAEHATDYTNFLRQQIASLASDPARGKRIGIDGRFRYLLMKRSQGGDGHIVVYRVQP